MFVQNVVDAILQSPASAPFTIFANFDQSTPVKIIEDSKKRYLAVYEDSAGQYEFEIIRRGNAFIVISDGLQVSRSSNVDYLKWNFETQLAKVSPRVFKQRGQ